jgi:hypothetical protein
MGIDVDGCRTNDLLSVICRVKLGLVWPRLVTCNRLMLAQNSLPIRAIYITTKHLVIAIFVPSIRDPHYATQRMSLILRAEGPRGASTTQLLASR